MNNVPSTGLKGPFSLDSTTINAQVKKNSIGAYALGHIKKDTGGFVPKYVGRSDNDLNGRLQAHIAEYPQFKFEYYSSAKKAFEKECNLYHDWKKQLDNKEHPDRPNGTDWKCPRCKTFE